MKPPRIIVAPAREHNDEVFICSTTTAASFGDVALPSMYAPTAAQWNARHGAVFGHFTYSPKVVKR